jgi:hypothetical protein
VRRRKISRQLKYPRLRAEADGELSGDGPRRRVADHHPGRRPQRHPHPLGRRLPPPQPQRRPYNLRFFAGQSDPNDPTHFTVTYELNGVKNTIDGYLTDDDFLRIIPAAGRSIRGSG